MEKYLKYKQKYINRVIKSAIGGTSEAITKDTVRETLKDILNRSKNEQWSDELEKMLRNILVMNDALGANKLDLDANLEGVEKITGAIDGPPIMEFCRYNKPEAIEILIEFNATVTTDILNFAGKYLGKDHQIYRYLSSYWIVIP